jgi:hypothetical protein
MSIDWNWFFSSFCQSAAALIGIIGAFIISRLLGLGEKISGTILQFDKYVIESNKIISSISNRRFHWYTKTMVRYNDDIKEGIKNGDFENLTKEEIINKILKADKRLYKVDNAIIESFEELYKKHKPTPKGGFATFPQIDLYPEGIWARTNQEKDNINQLEVEANSLIEYFHQNLQELNSFENTIKPLKIIIKMLMIAFPLTVIYPLHFMPIATNQNPEITFKIITIIESFFTLKFFLLSVFFLTIEGIFYYFLTLTNELTKSLKDAKENNSDDLRDTKYYSEYF